VKTYDQGIKQQPAPKKKSRNRLRLLVFVVVIIACFYGLKQTASTYSGHPAVAKTTPAVNSICSSNTLSQFIVVSISARHLWACNQGTDLYESAVITGMENLPADLTPVGTYHVYAKETNLYLSGCDTTGCWNDYVNYWMPFLDNQYGQYGFHDATWRTSGEFGNISPLSPNASHGCVEMPLAAAKWLYDWVSVGATVKIEA
jgi:lipoprotein-anchoring transpeptidase ErfK/SrfK